MIVSVIFGLLGMPALGIFVDKVSPTITIPTAFMTRFVSMLMFMFVSDPTTFYAYLCSVLMIFGTAFEQITIMATLFRQADREIRGTIAGAMQSFGYFGQLVFCLVGGILFDYINPYAPFAFIGILDFVFAITAIVMAWKGILRNDIIERQLKEYEAREAIRLMQKEESEKLKANDSEDNI